MSGIGAPEIIIIAVVVLILFGAKKLPDSARSLGRSLRIFKAETKGLQDDNQRAAPPLPPAGDDVTVNGQPLADRERNPS